jgi:hypothetical protein
MLSWVSSGRATVVEAAGVGTWLAGVQVFGG